MHETTHTEQLSLREYVVHQQRAPPGFRHARGATRGWYLQQRNDVTILPRHSCRYSCFSLAKERPVYNIGARP